MPTKEEIEAMTSTERESFFCERLYQLCKMFPYLSKNRQQDALNTIQKIAGTPSDRTYSLALSAAADYMKTVIRNQQEAVNA